MPSFEFRPEYPIKLPPGQAHTVTIKDQIFKPENLKVTQGDSVEFCLLADSVSENDFSLYYEKSRSHVISFDEVGFESPLVRISNRGTADKTKTTFVIHFYQEGTFRFICRIYTWMKGSIQVVPREDLTDEFESPPAVSRLQPQQ